MPPIVGRRGQAIWDGTSRESFHVHHQKGAFVRTASLGLRGLPGRHRHRHRPLGHAGAPPARSRGPGSTWHDVQCKIEGKAAWDVYRNIMQRWNAANALPDIVGADPGRTPLPAPDDPAWGPTSVVDDPTMTKADGPHAAQIIRTLGAAFRRLSAARLRRSTSSTDYRRSLGAEHLAPALRECRALPLHRGSVFLDRG